MTETLARARRHGPVSKALESELRALIGQSHSFLPDPQHRQRDFFDDVVVPLCKGDDRVAIFSVDAFRFEMATELIDEFESAKATTVHLNGRFAELPTVTSVGMNALAPVNHRGKMRPDVKNGSIRSFHSGQFQVKDPASRKRAMHEKVGGRTCPMLTLQEISGLDPKTLRRKIAGAKLIYVHSQEIDDAGEKNLGPVVFDYAMQSIRAAWQLLREAGVKQFVLTRSNCCGARSTSSHNSPYSRVLRTGSQSWLLTLSCLTLNTSVGLRQMHVVRSHARTPVWGNDLKQLAESEQLDLGIFRRVLRVLLCHFFAPLPVNCRVL